MRAADRQRAEAHGECEGNGGGGGASYERMSGHAGPLRRWQAKGLERLVLCAEPQVMDLRHMMFRHPPGKWPDLSSCPAHDPLRRGGRGLWGIRRMAAVQLLAPTL